MISNKKMILFLGLSNILIVSQISFIQLINEFKQNSWWILLLVMLIFVLIGLLFPGIKKNDKNIFKNKFIKILLTLYLLIAIIENTFLTGLIIKQYFYTEANILIILIVLLITFYILGTFELTRIFDVGIIFFLLTSVFYLIPLFNQDDRNHSLLLPIDIKQVINIYKAYLVFLFPLENIIYAYHYMQFKEGFRKKDFVIAGIISIVYLLQIIIDSISILGTNYFLESKESSYIRWQTFKGNKFIENFDIFLLVIMTVTICFRMALNVNTLLSIWKAKKKSKINILFILIFLGFEIILYVFSNIFNSILMYSLFVCLGLIGLIYLYIIISLRKNRKYQKTTKEKKHGRCNEQIMCE